MSLSSTIQSILNNIGGRKLSDDEISYLQHVDDKLDGIDGSSKNNLYNKKTLKRLFIYKYFIHPPSRHALSEYKVSELKEALKSNGLPTTGKKDVLIQRIIENMSEAKISSLFPRKVLTAKDAEKTLVNEFKLKSKKIN